MRKEEITLKAFFELVRAGLWNHDCRLSSFGKIDFNEIYRLALEQSIVGLIAAGIERVADTDVPQLVALTFASEVLQLEERNQAMNAFVGALIGDLQRADVYALLVKGQVIAQCYEKPLWRACGDVDLLLSDNNYKNAIRFLIPQASIVEDESIHSKHIAMTIDGWSVELHGTLRSGLWGGLDWMIDEIQSRVFHGGNVRLWQNGKTQVFSPGINEDVFFVFTHILQHYYKEGIGLRQICDWCRLLYTYRESLNRGLLESRIRKAGIMSEWKAFGALAVEHLGMPEEAMPMFGSKVKEFKGKANKIMDFVLETGNFGHNRDYSYRQKHSYLVFKAISMWKHIQDFGRYFVIFPQDAIKVTWHRMAIGFFVAIQGKRHE